MTTYLDTSVVVAVIVDEPRSAAIRTWVGQSAETMIISDLTALEFAAVISRAVRISRFDEAHARTALGSFDMLRDACAPYAHGRDDFASAELLVREFALKLVAADALHLASTIAAGAALATLDDRLAEAARAKGVALARMH